MTKPQETYIEGEHNGIKIKMFTGSVSLEPHPTDPLKGLRVERNSLGQIIESREYDSHIVCFGDSHCLECGRRIK